MLFPFPPLIPDAILSRAAQLSTAAICDGADPDLVCMDFSIKPLAPWMKFVGTAVTVETANGDNLPIHLATYATSQPGYVMVIDGKENRDRAYLGDLIVAAARAAGYSAIVTNSLVRDAAGTIDLGFPVFSAGVLPRGPIKKEPGTVNGKIRCGGISVSPGDMIMGDSDGVVVVPLSRIEEIFTNAEKKQRYETERRHTIEEYRNASVNGTQLPDMRPEWLKQADRQA